MLINREIQDKTRIWLNRPEILVILGARQVGKTSLIKLLQQEMADQPNFYLDLEDTFNLSVCESVDTFINYLTLRGLDKSQKSFCFLDEVQHLPEPTKFLKLLHDHHPYLKMIVTGSSAFEMRRKIQESLVGRKMTVILYPLNFLEYLRFQKSELEPQKKEITIAAVLEKFAKVQQFHLLTPKMAPLFEDFMTFGGYPRIVREPQIKLKKELLREIYNTYIQKDIRDLAKVSDPLKFNKLVTFLAVQVANLFRLDEAAKEISLAQKALGEYLFILENTFSLALVRPFSANLQKELTKMPKLFFIDTGLRNVIVNDFREPGLRTDIGAMAENSCFAELLKNLSPFDAINYWRTADGKEIDFVCTREDKTIIPIEVKYRGFVKPEVPPAMKYFIKQYQPPQAVIFTKDMLHQIQVDATRVNFVPLWMV